MAPSSKCVGIRNAIQKHGRSNFVIEIVQTNVHESELHAAEAANVEKFDTWKNGYNCTPGGDANPMDDPDVRIRHKATMSDPKFIARCLKKRSVTFATPEFKAKKKSSHTAVWKREGTRAKASKSHKMHWQKPGVKEQRGALMKKVWSDPEHHAVRAAGNAIRARADSTSKKKSATLTMRYKDPVWAAARKAKLDATIAKKKATGANKMDPEVVKKRTEVLKARYADPEWKAARNAKLQATLARKRAGE